MKIIKSALMLVSLIAMAGCNSNKLQNGPPSPGPHGPFSASDFNKDGTVTRSEIEKFMEQGPERRLGMVAYFDKFDKDKDKRLSKTELAEVVPEFAFDGADANGDGIVERTEVETYVNGRLYRQMGLGEFFDLIDTDKNGEVSPAEIEAAHASGKLPRG